MDIERKFLHDIATPITLIRLNARRLLKSVTELDPASKDIKLVEGILKSITDLENLHAEHKAHISKHTD
jgi:hypothetical protein